ncbi:glutathione S-transferase family protein [Salinisphaera sp.]|uniref:glutathione S-transferase family protein n=1 Tax=Salinisphaera sp. TaxID=1914330 RepID=UPI002D79DE33|nr:glutathione S-transferase family protein [Salinisphaera sp.]HET7313594.1 glutathione S-transferase family protein [Salinisphaera sp.]
MKLYETRQAPNPRRLRIFLVEKGINLKDFEIEQLDLGAGDNLSETFKTKNPMCGVPVLEFDDGRCLSESIAICRYFELTHPEPPLMGDTAEAQATIEMWNRRMELHLLLPVAMAFRHTTGHFADRESVFPDYGADRAGAAIKIFDFLDRHLADRRYIADENYTVADITALVAIDFARVVDIRIGDRPHLAAWHERVSTRPSAGA